MLNERRVKHMVKLASYESKKGSEEIKISSFFKKDYVNFSVVISLLWVTLGYFSLAGLICLALMERIVENVTFWSAVTVIAVLVLGYLLSLLFYGKAAARSYKKKYQAAKTGVRRYVRDLDILEKMYESEEA